MSGVTNRLIEAAKTAQSGNAKGALAILDELAAKHESTLEAVVKNEAERAKVSEKMRQVFADGRRFCEGTALLRELSPRTLDTISSLGERLSAPLVAAVVKELGLAGESVESSELIVTDDFHGGADPLMKETRVKSQARIFPLLEKGVVPVVTGFIGSTEDGELTTLGRGGSDYSATILGAALDAEEVIIWTDVDGVLTADPRLINEARTIPSISYREAAELAFFGAKVLHPKTLKPVVDSAIPVWIRNSFAPEKRGTKITPKGGANTGVKALTAIRDVTLISLGGPGIVGLTDVVGRTFSTIAEVRANVLMISQSSSQNDICFSVSSSDADANHRSAPQGVRRRPEARKGGAHQRGPGHRHRRRGGRKHARHSGRRRTHFSSHGQGKREHHRHCAGLQRKQYFLCHRGKRREESVAGRPPRIRPAPAGERKLTR